MSNYVWLPPSTNFTANNRIASTTDVVVSCRRITMIVVSSMYIVCVHRRVLSRARGNASFFLSTIALAYNLNAIVDTPLMGQP